jgi:hypothetical protein
MERRQPERPRAHSLPYSRPASGKNYWVQDDVLPNALEVVERCFSKPTRLWTLGAPWSNETWPGMRCPDALLPDELARVEDFVKRSTGVERLWQESSPEGGSLSHNSIQLVGAGESGPRPHTDSRKLCRFAGVLYLTPGAPADAGTSFYRLRLPDGALSGNLCPPPHANLTEALGVTRLPLEAWQEDVTVTNVFNRLVVYRADMVHSATRYFGTEPRSKRLTVVFFWMTP